MRILVADDHAVVRRGLKQILTDGLGAVICGEAATIPEAREQVLGEQKWDVMLLDISMPGGNGLELLKEIHDRQPRLPVVMLSVYPEEQFAVRAFKAGASGYLTKDSAPDELVRAVRKALEGGRYVCARLAERLAGILGGVEQALHEALSDREYDVLLRIASGRTVGEIAQDVHLSVKTISTYRARILTKMGMRTNAELTHYAIKRGLAE